MTTISIAFEESKAAVARVETLLAKTALEDCNWSGASFHIIRDDFTCIVDDDSYNAVALFGQIQDALLGE